MGIWHSIRAGVIASGIALPLVVLAACGGGGGTAEPTATTEVEATATEDGASTEAETIQVDESFWHAGWKVTLGEANLTPSEFSGGLVTIDSTFENVGPNNATFNSQLALTSGGVSYGEEGLEEEIPEVPGGLTGKGVLAFEVDAGFAFGDAVLIVGRPDENQAIVPLGSAATDELVSLEPREIAVSGQATAGAVTLNVERAELRADLPDWHQEVDEGRLSLTIFFSATVGTGIPVGQGVLQSDNVALKLPDGTALAVRSDGRSGVNELLQGKEGNTIPDLMVRFEVDEPPEGLYAFVVRGSYVPSRDTVEGELSFEIP